MKTYNIRIPKKVFNSSFYPYLNDTHRYLIFYGGAGSGKSFTIAQFLVYYLLTRKRFNLLVIRNTGKSNRDSTFALLNK